jgi:hypothetical protein
MFRFEICLNLKKIRLDFRSNLSFEFRKNYRLNFCSDLKFVQILKFDQI